MFMYSIYIRDKRGYVWTACSVEHCIVHILDK